MTASNTPARLPAGEDEPASEFSRCPRCGKLNVDVHTCSASPWAAEYERIKPALDALASAVKGCGHPCEFWGGHSYPCGNHEPLPNGSMYYRLCYDCKAKQSRAIHSLTRTLP